MIEDYLFSFILPAYKADFFSESISSILSQSYNNFELVIVDDNSPNNLKSIVDKFNDERITYYKNTENIGGKDLVAQWNHCIEYAKGDYIILAADDDIYDKDFLTEIIALINKYQGLNVYRGRIQNIDEIGNITRQELRIPELLTFDEFLLYEPKIMRCIGNIVFKADVLKANGFPNYPLAWYSDIAVIYKLMNDNIAITQNIVYSFRISTTHISAKKDLNTSYKKIIANCEYFKYLSNLLQNYENSDQFIKREIYKIYLKNDYMKFKAILNILTQLHFFQASFLLTKLKKSICLKQRNKLLVYYVIKKQKSLIKRFLYKE